MARNKRRWAAEMRRTAQAVREAAQELRGDGAKQLIEVALGNEELADYIERLERERNSLREVVRACSWCNDIVSARERQKAKGQQDAEEREPRHGGKRA